MINSLFNGLLSFATQLIAIILTPINTALSLLVPDLTDAVTVINNFWGTLSLYVRFVLSYTGIYSTNITIIVILIIANITIPWTVHGLKLIAKWWEVII